MIKQEKPTNRLEFKSRTLGLKAEITPRQKTAFDKMQFNNSHCMVRVRLSEIFFAPEEIVKTYKAIKRRTDKQGLSAEDYALRRETDAKLNAFILNNFGREAEIYAISVQ